MIRRLVPLAALAVAACVRPMSPTVATAPVPVAARPSATTAPLPAAGQAGRTGGAAAADGDSASVTSRDVTREALRVFGDSVAAVPTPDSAAADSGPKWDIDVRSFETQERVAHYVTLFAGDARDRIAARLQRGTRYEPMIRAKLHAAGLPEDMTYLALIESGYDPHAYSKAAAVGMWQLMASTARGTGLRVDWWVDERRDPVRSTDAAISFLRYLNDQFGSLYLAAAAYNGGPGRISRGLSRFASDMDSTDADENFFALAEKDYLPRETKEYVPQLIAAALVAKEPARYGLRITPLAPFAYDSVRVGGATPLAAVARGADTSLAAIVDLNPQFLRGITPLGTSSWVRVPVGRRPSFDSTFARLDPSARAAFREVISRKGQSLASIGEAAGVTGRQVGWYNPKLSYSKRGALVSGQTIRVPTADAVAGAFDVPDPSIERYGSSSSRKSVVHVVRHGETLGGIAKRYGTTTRALMRVNGLRRDRLFPGQTIVVRGGSSKAARSRTSASRSRGSRVSSAARARKGAAAKKSATPSRSRSSKRR